MKVRTSDKQTDRRTNEPIPIVDIDERDVGNHRFHEAESPGQKEENLAQKQNDEIRITDAQQKDHGRRLGMHPNQRGGNG